MLGVLLIAIAICARLVSAYTGSPSSCGDPEAGPVLGGIDLVAARANAGRAQTSSLPFLQGIPSIYASLGGYEFWFKSQANARAFSCDPLPYLPLFGGYCGIGIFFLT